MRIRPPRVRSERTMRIGVISDTHWHRPQQYLDSLDRLLGEVDLILHAGDVEESFVLERLQFLAPVMAVKGNCDQELPGWDLPRLRFLELEGVNIGIFHGFDIWLEDARGVVDYFGGGADLIIHGHLHVPRLDKTDSATIFCPGSPSQPRHSSVPSIGVITVEAGRFEARHFQV